MIETLHSICERLDLDFVFVEWRDNTGQHLGDWSGRLKLWDTVLDVLSEDCGLVIEGYGVSGIREGIVTSRRLQWNPLVGVEMTIPVHEAAFQRIRNKIRKSGLQTSSSSSQAMTAVTSGFPPHGIAAVQLIVDVFSRDQITDGLVLHVVIVAEKDMEDVSPQEGKIEPNTKDGDGSDGAERGKR